MVKRSRARLKELSDLVGSNLTLLFILSILTIGLGDAAISNRFSNTVEGNIKVSKGITYSLSPKLDNSSGSETFKDSLSSGGSLNLKISKKNLADDISQPSVETIVIDMEGESITWRELEKITSFRHKNKVARNYSLSISSRGNPRLLEQHIEGYETPNQSLTYDKTVSSTENKEFGVVNADTDADSQDEILICIAGSKGRRYSQNEEWNGSMTIDTKSSFPTGEISIKAGIMGLYDPETGAHPDIVRKCARFS